jgi:hypothetical protein
MIILMGMLLHIWSAPAHSVGRFVPMEELIEDEGFLDEPLGADLPGARHRLGPVGDFQLAIDAG